MTAGAARDPERRVVITGMGVMTPIGERLDDYIDALLMGRSAVTRWRAVAERCASKIGGDMSAFDLEAHLRRAAGAYPAELVQSARRLMRPTPLSGRITAPAAMQAFVDAGLPHPSIASERFGHVLAGHNVNSNYVYEGHKVYLEEPEYIDALYGVVSEDTDVLSNVVDVHIAALRRKLGADLIRTRRGEGYIIDA